MSCLTLWIPALCLPWILNSCASADLRSARRMQHTVNQAALHDLVDVRTAAPDVVIHLRYATSDNLTGKPLYPRHMPCLLRTLTLERLKQAQAILRAQGYGLCLWDAWRPPEAQEKLHAHAGDTGLFLNPGNGWSRHCGGVSVDATLVDAQGRELEMPTRFDENLEHASLTRGEPAPAVRQRVALLHAAMREAGLIPLEGEWWHFDDQFHLHDPVPVIWGRDVGVQID